ncbi:MAG: hypothetical protein U0837_03045 [Dehalococcoidia bacterium]|jgi:hypothetical protein
MKRWLLAASLPIVAILVVGAAVAVVLARRSADSPATATTAASGSERSGAPRLAPESNVCQGILHRPDPGAPRTFPAEYTQRREANGITVVGNAAVDPKAMDEAALTVSRVFAGNDLEEPLSAEGAYVIVASSRQGVLDLPEFRCMESASNEEFFSHVCGVADRADYPVVTVNELDLLGKRNGPCAGLNILYHELGHLVQGWTLGPADYIDIRLYYQDALSAGKYRRDYANTNPDEYFAEATQAYFLSTDPEGRRDREWLESYDPAIFALVARTYGD